MSDFHNQSRSDRALAAMLATFDAQPEHVQIQLISTLGQRGEPTHFGLLTQLLPTVQGEVRCAVIDVLSHDPEHARALLLNELQHPDPVVRWVASGLLSNLADKRTVSALLDCLTSDPDSDVRINAAVALGRIGDPRAISMLEWVSQHDSGVGRQGHQVGSTASTAIQQIVERQSGTVQE